MDLNIKFHMVVFFLILTLLGCKQQSNVGSYKPIYKQLDSGHLINGRVLNSIVWLNDSEVMFVGNRQDKHLNAPQHWLGVWDVDDGGVEIYKEYGERINCYNPINERIAYLETNKYANFSEKERFLWVGKYKEERKVSLPVRGVDFLDSLNCEYVRNVVYPEDLKGARSVAKLLKDHGFLSPSVVSRSVATKDEVLVKFDQFGRKQKSLPFTRGEIEKFSYVQFKDAYLIERGNSGFKGPIETKERHIGWWLYPNGDIEELLMPPRDEIGPLSGSAPKSMSYYPTQKGLFFSFLSVNESIGGYLVSTNGIVKVIEGAIYGVSVSPNGCRVAFEYQSSPMTYNARALKMMDVCSL